MGRLFLAAQSTLRFHAGHIHPTSVGASDGGAKILRLLLTNYKLREGKQPAHLNSYKATLYEELRKIALTGKL